MTNSIYVNNKIKLVKITLTEEMLEEAYWLNVFYEHDDGEVGYVEEILYLTDNFNEYGYSAIDELVDAVNKSELIRGEYNDCTPSDEECYDAGDTVWALVDNTHNA